MKMNKKSIIILVAVGLVIVIGITIYGLNKANILVFKDGNTKATISSDESSGTVTTNEGSLKYGDSLSWPTSDMGNLPKVSGKISGVVKDNSNKTCSVAFKEVSENDAKSYKTQLVNLGYVMDVDMSSTETIYFSGKLATGDAVYYSYDMTSKEGMIVYTPSTASSTPTNTSGTDKIDKTDLANWPTDIMGSIPELQGKIMSVTKNNDKEAIISMEYVEKTDFNNYIDKVKQLGYTESMDKTEESNYIKYAAYNTAGDWISVIMNIEDNNNKVSVRYEKATE